MSGFYADNSRIRVLDTVDTVDETVFDTDEDMPHIVGTADQSVEISFTNLTQSSVQDYLNYCIGTYFVSIPYYYTECFGYTVCFGLGDDCWYSEFCQFIVDYYVYEECYSGWQYRYYIDTRELSETVDICALPTDEDGNTVDVDFVIIQASGSRTTAGKDPRFDQALVSTVPGKTFSLQGSMFLEGAGRTDGTSWLRRIMSVVVDNASGKLKLKKQESVGSLRHPNLDTGFNNLSTKSVFSFNFKVFFGRFKS